MKLIWTKTKIQDDLKSLSSSDKKNKLLENFRYDEGMVSLLEDDQLNSLIDEDPYLNNQNINKFDDLRRSFENQSYDNVLVGVPVDGGESRIFDIPSAKNTYAIATGDNDNQAILFDERDNPELAYRLYAFPQDRNEFTQAWNSVVNYDNRQNFENNLNDPYDDLHSYVDSGDLEDLPLDQIKNNLVPVKVECFNEDLNAENLTEARIKDNEKEDLVNELAEIKPLADEYGFEYFTQMPFSNYENDPSSFEFQYPVLAKLVKSYFKEMGILSAEEIKDQDIMDDYWDSEFYQDDWDTLLDSADQIIRRGKAQFEKVYGKHYTAPRGESEIEDDSVEVEDESLNEALPKDLIQASWGDDTLFKGRDQSRDASHLYQDAIDIHNSSAREVTPEEAAKIYKQNPGSLKLLLPSPWGRSNDKLVDFHQSPTTGKWKPSTKNRVEYGEYSPEANDIVYVKSTGEKVYDTKRMPASHLFKIAKKIYVVDEVTKDVDLMTKRSQNAMSSRYSGSTYSNLLGRRTNQKGKSLRYINPNTPNSKLTNWSRTVNDVKNDKAYSRYADSMPNKKLKDKVLELSNIRDQISSTYRELTAKENDRNEFDNRTQKTIQSREHQIEKYKEELKELNRKIIKLQIMIADTPDAAAFDRMDLDQEIENIQNDLEELNLRKDSLFKRNRNN